MSTETPRSTDVSRASVPQPRGDSDLLHGAASDAVTAPPPIPGKNYRMTWFWRIYDQVSRPSTISGAGTSSRCPADSPS